MIEVICNDRLGKKIRVKCNPDDTVGDLKKLLAAQIGTRSEKLRIQKWYTVYKDHISLEDYEIHDGMGLELYYNWAARAAESLLGLCVGRAMRVARRSLTLLGGALVVWSRVWRERRLD